MTPPAKHFVVPGSVATAALLLACLSIVLLGVHLQSQVHINHDVGWIAHSAAWLLDGRKFGTDILDPNPPMAWFLMLPVAMVVRAGLAPEILAIQVWSWLLVCAGLALAFRILLPLSARLGRPEVAVMLIAATAAVSILPVGNFGQREIIAFSLLLPYQFLLTGRLLELPLPRRRLLILVGLVAGCGLCLKPFLVAVPLVTELLHALLTRKLRVVLRAETVAMGAVVLAYMLSVLALAPGYFDYALPLIRAVYWAYDDSGYLILSRFKAAAWPAVYAIAIAIACLSVTRVHAVLLAAFTGFSVSYWAQDKGFPYHAYPILGTSCILFAYSVTHAMRSILVKPLIAAAPIRMLIAILVLLIAVPVLRDPFRQALAWYEAGHRSDGEFGLMRQGPIDRLRSLGIQPADYIYAFSTHPNPGFPTVNYLGVHWAGRAVAQFVIPAHVRKSELTDPEVREAIDRATGLQVEQVIADLARYMPAYVMVEARQRRLGLAYRRFDDLAFYGKYPEFSRLWSCYEEIKPVGQVRLFRRRDVCAAGTLQKAAN
ncbi:MAG: hypothetical protein ACREVI_06010 [Steroidobacteraceae bacterium]